MKIVDGFIFYNELDLLELRLKELYDVVDYFIITEASLTFAGNKKGSFYLDNKDRYREFSDKIIHIYLKDLPGKNEIGRWEREELQRNGIINGIKYTKNVSFSDAILISDVDEIPNPDLLMEIKKHGLNIFVKKENNVFSNSDHNDPFLYSTHGVVALLMDFYYYNIECKLSSFRWWFPKISTIRRLNQIGSCQELRTYPTPLSYSKAGWHFSYFGDVDFIVNKIKNFSHSEYDTDEWLDPERIKKVINDNKDLFMRDDSHEWDHVPVETNDFLPKHYKIIHK